MSSLWCIVGLLSLFLGVQAQLPFSAELSPGYTLSWGINPNATEITMEVSVVLDGPVWIGVGWHELDSSNDGMTQADFVIAIFNESGLFVSDYFANKEKNGFTKPLLDTTQPYPGGVDNIISYEGSQQTFMTADGPKVITTFQFRRLMDTRDAKADHPIVPGQMKVIHAHGKSDTFGFHGKGNSSQSLIDFFEGSATSSDSLYNTLLKWHASFMFGAFAILLTFGVFIARYLRKNQWWFWIHFTTQVSAIIMMGTGFTIAVIAVQHNGEVHFDGPHTMMGLATIIMAFLVVPTIGIIAHWFRDPTRKKAPMFPNQAHYWLGRVTILMGYLTILLGMNAFPLPHPVWFVFGVLLGFYFLIGFICETFRILDGKHFLSRYLPYSMRLYFEGDRAMEEHSIQRTRSEETAHLVG